MRDDMNKVLAKHKNRKKDRNYTPHTRKHFSKDEIIRAIEDDEYDASSLPFRPNWWDIERQAYPNTSVLKRFLKSRVGQPWDDVYSELSAIKEDICGYSINDVLKWLVETSIRMVDGVPHSIIGRRWYGQSFPVEGLYVDMDGILRYAPERTRRYSRKQDPNVIVLESMHQLNRIDGIWFEVWYKIADTPDIYGKRQQVIQRKKTLSAKELKHYKLSNVTEDGRLRNAA